MPIEDFIVPGIGAAFNIVDGAISRGQAKRDAAQAREWFLQDREYNSPKNQLSRIHEAGLPSAAYFGGSASSQAEIFKGDIAQTDTGLGKAGENISKFFSTRMERIATETAQTNLEILKNEKKLKDIEIADQLKVVPDAVYDEETSSDVVTMLPRVLKEKRQKARMEDVKESAMILERDLKGIEHEIRSATTKEEINIVRQKLDNIIQDTLGKKEDVYRKQTENKYLENDLQFRQRMREIRGTIFDAIRNGKFPKIGEIMSLIALALENRL